MAEYRVIVVGKAGGSQPRVAELEQAEVESISWQLNGAGAMSIALPTSDLKGKTLELVKREIQVWRDSSLFWWGVPWRLRGDPSKHTVECEGLFSYFFRRFVLATRSYSQVDQLAIAWDLLNYAQTQAGGALGITSATFLPSGVLRDRTYPADEHGRIGDLVRSFTELQNGFDFEIEIFGDGRREWTPYYPSKGVTRNEMILEWGRNVLAYRYSKDAVRMANQVVATGSGEGTSKLEAIYTDIAARDDVGLLSDVVAAGSEITEIGTLTERATESVRLGKNPVLLPEIQVSDSPVQMIGVVKTGDRVPVRISDGITDLSGTFRVVAISLDPKIDRMWLTLNAA